MKHRKKSAFPSLLKVSVVEEEQWRNFFSACRVVTPYFLSTVYFSLSFCWRAEYPLLHAQNAANTNTGFWRNRDFLKIAEMWKIIIIHAKWINLKQTNIPNYSLICVIGYLNCHFISKGPYLSHSLGYFFCSHYFNLLKRLPKLDTVKRNTNLLLPHFCSTETSKGLHLFKATIWVRIVFS